MTQKFIDRDGLKVLWNQISLKDYPNNETLMAVIDAIDETKANKDELFSKSWNDLEDKPFGDDKVVATIDTFIPSENEFVNNSSNKYVFDSSSYFYEMQADITDILNQLKQEGIDIDNPAGMVNPSEHTLSVIINSGLEDELCITIENTAYQISGSISSGKQFIQFCDSNGMPIFEYRKYYTDGVLSKTTSGFYVHFAAGAWSGKGVIPNVNGYSGIATIDGVPVAQWNGKSYDFKFEISKIKQIDDEFIPDNIARIKDLDNAITQSDWNQIDDTSKDYIKNRPFGLVMKSIDVSDIDLNSNYCSLFAGSPSYYYHNKYGIKTTTMQDYLLGHGIDPFVPTDDYVNGIKIEIIMRKKSGEEKKVVLDDAKYKAYISNSGIYTNYVIFYDKDNYPIFGYDLGLDKYSPNYEYELVFITAFTGRLSQYGITPTEWGYNSSSSKKWMADSYSFKYYYNGEALLDEQYIPDTIARQADVDSALESKADVNHNHDSVYETKTDAQAKLDEAKAYADTAVANLVNSAPETLDTLGELATAFEENKDVVDALNEAIVNKADVDHVHSWEQLENKPFYDTLESTVIFDQDVQLISPNNGLVGYFGNIDYLSEALVNNIGGKMNILINSDSYNCIVKTADAKNNMIITYVGNGEYLKNTITTLSEVYDTGEPFLIFDYAGTIFFMYKSEEEIMLHTVITLEKGELKQLDEKFIPDSVKVQADWNVNDENNPAYVKNRPFYTGDLTMTEKYNDTLAFIDMGEDMSDLSGFYASESTIEILTEDLVVGDPIRIVYDNIIYDLVVQGNDMLGTYIGNGAIISKLSEVMGMSIELPDTGEPFATFVGGFVVLSDEPSHDISISIYETEHIQLDRKYIKEIPGLKTKGLTYVINNEEVVAENGAEIFNDYEENIATGKCAHAEGSYTKATGKYSHAEGSSSKATGDNSHAEGYATDAIGQRSHAECSMTIASGWSSHAEGHATVASGRESHAEGQGTISSGECSHAEGSNTKAMGNYSHAEGYGYDSINKSLTVSLTGEAGATTFSISEDIDERYKDMLLGNDYPGQDNPIIDCTIVDNKITEITFKKSVSTRVLSNQKTQLSLNYLIAKGEASHAEGIGTMAYGNYQHTQGKYNVVDNESVYTHIVGNGESDTARSNAHTLDWQGNAWYQGSVEATAIILKSPNGTRFSITVGDDGVLTSTEITE